MTLQLLLNDLSFPDDDCAIATAADRLHGLVATLRAVTTVTGRHVLNAAVPFAQISFGRGRPLATLRNEHTSAEERVYLKTVADRSPWTAAQALRRANLAGGAEYRLPDDAATNAGEEAVALGLAHDLGGLAISLPTHGLWRQTTIALRRLIIDDATGELEETDVASLNASNREQVGEHAEAIRRAVRPSVHDGAELWERRAELLPALDFVPTVRQQIYQLPHGDPNLDGALERLVDLDEAIGAWRRDSTAQPHYPFPVVPESRRRITAGLVDIKDGGGVVRTFSCHARYGPDENRIHFILETVPVRRALVGHVGRKLGVGMT